MGFKSSVALNESTELHLSSFYVALQLINTGIVLETS